MTFSAYTAHSAKSGFKYPQKTSELLGSIAKKFGYKSQYWITSGQVNHFSGVQVPQGTSGHPMTFIINEKDVNVMLYNIEQISNNSAILRHIEELKKR